MEQSLSVHSIRHAPVTTGSVEVEIISFSHLPIAASVTLAVLVVVVMVMAFLFPVVVFASRFWVDVGHYHLAFIADHFAVTSSIAGVAECFLA